MSRIRSFQQVIRIRDETKPACLLDQPVQTQRRWEVTEHALTGDLVVGEVSTKPSKLHTWTLNK